MKKKICSILIISVIILLIINAICLTSTAAELKDIYSGTTDSRIKTPVATVLGLIQAIGYATAVIMLVYIGIKYILATPDGKADLKKQLVPYLIGIILLFAGSALISIIGGIAKGF